MPMFHVKHLLIVVMLGGAMASASAQKMYRCPGASGSTTFSDTPCATGQGGEVSVKPSAGAAAKPAESFKSEQEKLLADALVKMSPECRRAYEAFNKKTTSKEGLKELQTPGNPITTAWMACDIEQLTRAEPSTAERAKVEAQERNRVEQNKIAQRKSECSAKQKVLDDRRPRLNTLSEADRIAFQTVEKDVAANCR